MKPSQVTQESQISKKKRALYIVCGMQLAVFTVLLAFVGAVFAVVGVNGYPLHASCKVKWRFPIPCANATDAIVNQINVWKGDEGCKHGGEKCLYTLISVTGNKTVVKAMHETPVKRYKDDLTFTFTAATADPNVCTCDGHSTSETWYAILDYGTNYCNMHNLITGSGLDKMTGYKEDTSNSKCTQFSTADCNKY